MPSPTPAPAGPRRDNPVRREPGSRGAAAQELPEGRATDAQAWASQCFGALLSQARSQGQGGGGGGRQSERGRPGTAAPGRPRVGSRVQADAALAQLQARCSAAWGEGEFQLLLPGGVSLAVQHHEAQGCLHLRLRTEDTDLARLLRRERSSLALQLSQRAGGLVALEVA